MFDLNTIYFLSTAENEDTVRAMMSKMNVKSSQLSKFQ